MWWTVVGLQRRPVDMAVQAARLLMDCEAGFAAAAACRDVNVAQIYALMATQAREQVAEWQEVVTQLGGRRAAPAASQRANACKASIARRVGRRLLALALYNNTAAQVQAYRRLIARSGDPLVEKIARRFLPDAERHRQWTLAMLQGHQVKS